jgi:hypothetical protein
MAVVVVGVKMAAVLVEMVAVELGHLTALVVLAHQILAVVVVVVKQQKVHLRVVLVVLVLLFLAIRQAIQSAVELV